MKKVKKRYKITCCFTKADQIRYYCYGIDRKQEGGE